MTEDGDGPPSRRDGAGAGLAGALGASLPAAAGAANGPAAGGLSDAATSEFEGLWRRCRGRLLAYANRHIPPALRVVLDPQDAVQDVFLAALVGWGRFDAAAGPRWLMAVARNQIINAAAAHAAAKRGGRWAAVTDTAAADDDEPAESALDGQAAGNRTPIQCAMDHEAAASLERSISRLAPHQQQAVRLHFIEGQCVEAVAAALGRSAGSIHMLCNRALKVMREELRPGER